MLIWRYRPQGGVTNFGDELNTYLWPKLLPASVQAWPGTFLGIGTVLGGELPAGPKVVFGSGLGYAAPQPLVDAKVYFVRGPHTAAALGGAPWITDPGILVHHFKFLRYTDEIDCAFMPRWDSVSPELVAACDEVGIHVIDPRLPVEHVVTEIKSTKLLLTEALHGAVVADALRVPWISIYGDRGHERKWYDWTASLSQIWNPIDMASFTLSWARDFAVPQLSAQSILDQRKRSMDGALALFIDDIEKGRIS